MNASRLNQLLAALFLASMTQQAFAYTTIKCGGSSTKWSGNNYTVRASSVGFPVGPWRDALSSVISHWNGNPSNLSFGVVWNEPAVAANNNENEAWWEANNGPNIGTYPAVTYVWFKSDCALKEADVIFNNSVAYHYTTSKTSLWPYGGANRPFQTTAMHEFGHAAGLAHTANTYNIMGSDWTHIHANGATATAYSGEDANNGLVAVYGLWAGGPEDLGVVHWKHIGSSGEYSTHGRTRILNTSNIELTKVAGTTEPVYRVNKGQTIKLELTYENLGKTSPLAAKVGYYLSSNDIISVADRFLGEGNVTLYRGVPDTTFNTFLVIPSDLVSGQTYWVGAIIDYNNAYSERSETNNATYIGIRVN
ncbi:hypothetical protein [Nitrosomonas oligotropha]|uniref:CARDB domain-containing protein n=1 Tax=Nitrosomonas oligotropha TaxID=42354 RepID=A0A1H8SK81_9PROT|nr:hypothetical protein [Nitrosomonas oligotropha]SDX15148.1 hypothetical protein SAMN05216300_12030 [Nitrosomonas oligotropha]SEO79092.1 hypothetical protein SAMN05216333_11930 [Nitrosomonas oligotropha]